jgi:hypothetical protein
MNKLNQSNSHFKNLPHVRVSEDQTKSVPHAQTLEIQLKFGVE